MRLKPIILVSLLAVTLAGAASACGYSFVTYDAMFFRLYDENKKNPFADSFKMQNSKLWQSQVGGNVAAMDIYYAIYNTTSADWLALKEGREQSGSEFMSLLQERNDTSAINIIYYSKCFDEVREAMADPWYYSVANDEEYRRLEAVAEWARTARCDRYPTRIGLLKAKSLVTTGRDAELVKWWKQHSKGLPNDILREKIEGYVAGAIYRTGDTNEAIRMFVKLGDYRSLTHVSKSPMEALRLLVEVDPEAECIKMVLQSMLAQFNSFESAARYDLGVRTTGTDMEALMDFCNECIANPRVRNKALWQYALSAMQWMQGKPMLAMRTLEFADLRHADEFLKTSVRLTSLLYHVQSDPIDEAYENMLLREMRWLDGLLAKDAPRHKDRGYLDYGTYGGEESFYLSDAMMQLLLNENGVVNRLKEAGSMVRALQFANYACNRVPQLVDGQMRKSENWRKAPKLKDGEGFFNFFDFSNRMFLLTQEQAAWVLVEYRSRVESPRNGLDRFMSTRGQHDASYWNDIIGTAFLREGNYGRAVQYLAKVRDNYQECTNYGSWAVRDPFSYDSREVGQVANAKLAFAKRMKTLEEKMMTVADPNDLADTMLLYSIGMRSSAQKCWWLVAYYHSVSEGEVYWLDNLNTSRQVGDRQYLMRRQAVVQAQALALYTDPERAAKAYARLFMPTTVMTKYGNTEQAAYYVAHCDKWRDWKALSRGENRAF